MLRFSIRDVLWLTVVVAISCGWWIGQSRLKQEIDRLTPKRYAMFGSLSEAELITMDVDDNASTSNPSAGSQNLPLKQPSDH
jgi:hypothetical protein